MTAVCILIIVVALLHFNVADDTDDELSRFGKTRPTTTTSSSTTTRRPIVDEVFTRASSSTTSTSTTTRRPIVDEVFTRASSSTTSTSTTTRRPIIDEVFTRASSSTTSTSTPKNETTTTRYEEQEANRVTLEHLYDHGKRLEWLIPARTSWYGQSCDRNLYVTYMGPVWDVFLKDPDDEESVILFNKVLKAANEAPNATEFWRKVCFSRSLEECHRDTHRCDCYNNTRTIGFRIDQVAEEDRPLEPHCGIRSKLSCKPWESQTNRGRSIKAPKLEINCEFHAKCNAENICECAVHYDCNLAIRKLLFPHTHFVSIVFVLILTRLDILM